MADAVVDLAAVDTQATETVDTQQDTFETPSTDVSQQTDQTGQQSSDGQQVDGRVGPRNYRNAAKAASEALPEHAQTLKEMADAAYTLKAHQQVFKTPQEATTAKQLIEGIGGVEGAAKMQERIQGYDAQDEALKSGSPEVLDSFFKDFPEGAAALAPHYLDRLSQVNPQAYADAVGPHAIALLERAGVGGHLQAILNETDPARQKSLLTQLNDWFKGQSQNAAQLKQTSRQTVDPQKTKLDARAQELNQREEKIFTDSANSMAVPKIEAEITKQVEAFARQYKLGPEQKQKFGEFLSREIGSALSADQTYMQQVKIRKTSSKNDPGKVADYIVSAYAQRLPETALKLARSLYGAPRGGPQQTTGQVKAGGTATAPGGGPLFVSQRPPDSELDLNKPDAEMNLIRGRAWTKAGKFITWRKATA